MQRPAVLPLASIEREYLSDHRSQLQVRRIKENPTGVGFSMRLGWSSPNKSEDGYQLKNQSQKFQRTGRDCDAGRRFSMPFFMEDPNETQPAGNAWLTGVYH
jgi:hypothetical protein